MNCLLWNLTASELTRLTQKMIQGNLVKTWPFSQPEPSAPWPSPRYLPSWLSNKWSATPKELERRLRREICSKMQMATQLCWSVVAITVLRAHARMTSCTWIVCSMGQGHFLLAPTNFYSHLGTIEVSNTRNLWFFRVQVNQSSSSNLITAASG